MNPEILVSNVCFQTGQLVRRYSEANVAELRKRMPIQRKNVMATFKSKGGFNDEVNVRLPKMHIQARSVVDPVKRALEAGVDPALSTTLFLQHSKQPN